MNAETKRDRWEMIAAAQHTDTQQTVEEDANCAGAVEKRDDVALLGVAVADQLQVLLNEYQQAKDLHANICKQVDWLFRAAMRAVIAKRVNLEFMALVRENKLFDADIVRQYGITATELCMHEFELEIKGKICGTPDNPNPYQQLMGQFSAEFIHDDDDGYSLYRAWACEELDELLDGVFLDHLPANPDFIETLQEVKAWLDSFVMLVRLGCD